MRRSSGTGTTWAQGPSPPHLEKGTYPGACRLVTLPEAHGTGIADDAVPALAVSDEQHTAIHLDRMLKASAIVADPIRRPPMH
jgi:hypothetical protein